MTGNGSPQKTLGNWCQRWEEWREEGTWGDVLSSGPRCLLELEQFTAEQELELELKPFYSQKTHVLHPSDKHMGGHLICSHIRWVCRVGIRFWRRNTWPMTKAVLGVGYLWLQSYFNNQYNLRSLDNCRWKDCTLPSTWIVFTSWEGFGLDPEP